jgi:hypothetical protein
MRSCGETMRSGTMQRQHGAAIRSGSTERHYRAAIPLGGNTAGRQDREAIPCGKTTSRTILSCLRSRSVHVYV